MRYALRSGILAARSLIEGTDYRSLWRRQLLPQLRASVTNRMLFELARAAGRRWVVRRHLAGGDVRETLRRLYLVPVVSRLLFPLAYWRHRRRLADPSCDHIDCACVWCRCGGARAVPQIS
jgi:hypothetical protein